MEKNSQKRQKVYEDIKAMFGMVPGFLKLLPDSNIEEEWAVMKLVQLEKTLIPNKYRELLGLGVAAATHCKYCTLFHSEAAKMNGATDEEIEEAVHLAKNTMGWSTYLNGMQVDFDEFKKEMEEMKKMMEKR